jgi:hypothetical protein
VFETISWGVGQRPSSRKNCGADRSSGKGIDEFPEDWFVSNRAKIVVARQLISAQGQVGG